MPPPASMPHKTATDVAVDPVQAAADAAAKAAQIAADAARAELARLSAQAAEITAKMEAVQARIPRPPVDPKNPATWPWGIMVKALRPGFYPDRIKPPGSPCAQQKRREVGEVFEIAHEGHYSPYDGESTPAGWMGRPEDPVPSGLDPNLPMTTAGNQVMNPHEASLMAARAAMATPTLSDIAAKVQGARHPWSSPAPDQGQFMASPVATAGTLHK